MEEETKRATKRERVKGRRGERNGNIIKHSLPAPSVLTKGDGGHSSGNRFRF